MRNRVGLSFYAIVVAWLLGGLAQPVWATLPTPSQPVLVVQNSSSTDPYQNFVPELLTTEGLNGFQTAQLTDLTAAFLANYDVVILPHLTLTAAQATLFSNYVNAGGTLVGFRPDLQLANVFGVASLGTTLSEGWLKIDMGTAYGSGLDSHVMKFHGVADMYSLNGASALATLYNSSTSATASPAAAIYSFGSGKAILFSFDLTQSNVLMRQGNPAWAGYPNNHDGYNTLRASQMFMDKGSSQSWNDLGDGALNDVPQADIQLRLFSNALVLTNSTKRPLPRFWYFPNQNRAMLLFTGDEHAYDSDLQGSINETNAVQSFGGKFSEFLWYPFGLVSNSQVNTWLAAGHAMGVHFDDTAEVDSSGVGGSAASWSGMQSVITNALSSFATTYPSAPTPITTRDHFLIWLSRNAAGTPDQTAQAKLFQAAGVQLDVSYTAFPNRWGYMTGSGLPMKFLDATTGTVIPVYEQPTQYEDDVQMGGAAYSTAWSLATAQTHYQQSLSDSLTKYNTVVTMLFHPDSWSSYSSYAQTVLQYAQTNSIPMYSTAAWLQFWKGRVATAISMPAFSSNTLSFTASNVPAGLTLLVPRSSGINVIATLSVDGVSQNLGIGTYQGVQYASVVLAAGTHNVSAIYAPPSATYTISGTISPSASGSGTTLTLSGTASATTTADGTGNYTFTGLISGSYTVTPSKNGFTFSPANAPVTVNNSNVTRVNFTATANPAGQTLFTTQAPAITNATDGSGVNYELGMAFTSSSSGQITGIRFWKTNNESGTHTGKIWSSTGSLLTSVAFTGETASGWQQQLLSSPLSIAANTTYVVSVNTGNTYYVATNSGLASQVVNGFLKSVVGNNGLFGSTGAFPTSSWQASNYFRDIVFVPGTTYSISGNVSANGSGATVTLSGVASSTTTADVSGNYTFTGLANGGYTLTPSKSGYTFSPTSASATVNSANVAGVNFTATALTYSISGNVSAIGSGATVTLSGAASATTTADVSGNYTFTGLANGSYTVTPSKSGLTFNPTSASATVNNASVTGISFTATGLTYSISGSVSATGSGATVTLTGAASSTTTADISGNYTFTGLANGSYTVTPTKTGYAFSPTSLPETVNGANVTGVNFTETAIPTYSISGTVSPVVSGTTVALTGAASASTTVDGSGNYTFTGLANGSYTVTPAKAGYTFSPTSLPETVNGANITSVNFTETAIPTYSISGNVSANGSGATVTLSGAASATTTADASGNYTFNGLVNGSYTVTPSKSGFAFTPLNQAVTINSANMTANFTAAVSAVITIDATASGDRTSPATTVVTAAFSTTASNELLLAMVGTDVSTSSGTNNSVTGVTGGGLTWVLVQRTNTQRGTAEIWRAFATASLTNVTVTATYALSNVSSITVMSFKGVISSGTSGSGAIGATGSGNATAGSPTASLVTTGANSLVIGVGEDWNAAPTVTAGANQTVIHVLPLSGLNTFWMQQQNAVTPASGTTVTITDTVPVNDMYNMAICEILAGS